MIERAGDVWYNGFENIMFSILIYFFIFSSWVNYFKSITINLHSDTQLGLGRFGIDLFIIYIYYYLVSIIDNRDYHAHVFVYVLPVHQNIEKKEIK